MTLILLLIGLAALINALSCLQSKLAENEAEYHKLKVELALWKNRMNGISHREIKRGTRLQILIIGKIAVLTVGRI